MTQPRRTQEQRRSQTRRKILDATVRCLVEHGYSATTTVRVVELAGVTRGALAHHFESKADMVTAAVGHLTATRTEEMLPKLAAARHATDPIDAGLELLWAVHQGPLFVAVVELWVAARTDATLRGQIAALERSTTSQVVDFAKGLFGNLDPDVESALVRAIYTAMDAVRGILLMKIALPLTDEQYEARWRRAKATLRPLFEQVTGAPA